MYFSQILPSLVEFEKGKVAQTRTPGCLCVHILKEFPCIFCKKFFKAEDLPLNPILLAGHSVTLLKCYQVRKAYFGRQIPVYSVLVPFHPISN